MPLLYRSLNLYKIQQGFKLRFAGSKDCTHSTIPSACLEGYLMGPGHSIESENALKAREDHRVS